MRIQSNAEQAVGSHDPGFELLKERDISLDNFKIHGCLVDCNRAVGNLLIIKSLKVNNKAQKCDKNFEKKGNMLSARFELATLGS